MYKVSRQYRGTRQYQGFVFSSSRAPKVFVFSSRIACFFCQKLLHFSFFHLLLGGGDWKLEKESSWMEDVSQEYLIGRKGRMSSLRVAQILGVCEFTTFEEIWGLGNACQGSWFKCMVDLKKASKKKMVQEAPWVAQMLRVCGLTAFAETVGQEISGLIIEKQGGWRENLKGRRCGKLLR